MTSESVAGADKESHRNFKSRQSNTRDRNLGFFFFFSSTPIKKSMAVTPWTGACQAPLSVEFSRQEYWNGCLFPSPGNLPEPGIEQGSPALQAEPLSSEPPGKPQTSKALEQISREGET